MRRISRDSAVPHAKPSSSYDSKLSNLDSIKYMNEERYLVNPCQKKYVCPLCDQLLSEPVQTERGELACRKCYQTQSIGENACPIDGEPRGEVFPDIFTLREINNLQCRCVFEKYGCTWIGALVDINSHEEKCEHRTIPCNICNKDIEYKFRYEHEEKECSGRNVDCQFCKKTMRFADIEEHESACEEKTLSCPFNCNELLTKGEAHLHVNNCRNIQDGIVCPFSILGCTFQPGNKGSLNLHLANDSLVHVSLACKAVNSAKHAVRDLTTQLNMEKSRTSQLENELQKVNEQVKALSQKYEEGMKVRSQIQFNGGNEQIEILERSINQASQRVKDLDSYMSNYQLEHDESFKKLQTMQSALNNIIPSQEFDDYSQTKKDLEQLSKTVELIETKQAQYISHLSDAELSLQLLENTAYNGRMVWKIDNFLYRTNQAELGKVTVLHSAPCFTKMFEYKFCSRLYLNGDGLGKCSHISLFVCFMKSPYDDQLTWPVTKKVTFRLLHPDGKSKSLREQFITDKNSSSFKKPSKDMNIAAGCPLFIKKDRIVSEGFVVNDSIYIETLVEDPFVTSSNIRELDHSIVSNEAFYQAACQVVAISQRTKSRRKDKLRKQGSLSRTAEEVVTMMFERRSMVGCKHYSTMKDNVMYIHSYIHSFIDRLRNNYYVVTNLDTNFLKNLKLLVHDLWFSYCFELCVYSCRMRLST